jgi:hypothetical protein
VFAECNAFFQDFLMQKDHPFPASSPVLPMALQPSVAVLRFSPRTHTPTR